MIKKQQQNNAKLIIYIAIRIVHFLLVSNKTEKTQSVLISK